VISINKDTEFKYDQVDGKCESPTEVLRCAVIKLWPYRYLHAVGEIHRVLH
jgi:hypothetical protein